MKKCRENLNKWTKLCFEGEMTLPKVTLWLAAAVCLLAGVVYGLRTAPRTHGIQKYCGCNNGNGNSYCGGKERRCEDEEEEDWA